MLAAVSRPLTLSRATATVGRRMVASPSEGALPHLKPRPVSDSPSFTLSLYPIRHSSSFFPSFSNPTRLAAGNHSSFSSSPSRLTSIRSKMTSNSPPSSPAGTTGKTGIAIPQQQQHATTTAASSTEPLTSSSPVYSRAHPFLRKFQSTVSKVVSQQQLQQNQGVLGTVAGSSSFSTSSKDGDKKSSTVDDAIAAVAAKTSVRSKSPTAAAANATDAIINKRLSQIGLDDVQSTDHTVHGHGCGCSGHGSVSEMDAFFSDDEAVVEPSHFPPISAEAREFSERLLGQNKAWAKKTEQDRPGFFAKLELQQKPQVLWIGCSDSRVPANQIVNLDPGEIFVHRNIANVVTHTDMNLLSVLEYAVDVLKVRHVIICGHYGCGGVAASLTQKQFGIIDNWLRNIKDLYTIHRKKFDTLPQGGKEQQDLLTELNVIQSALNVCHTSIIQKAWSRGEKLSVHGWCYRLSDGVIRNLGLCIEGPGNVEEVYHVMDEVKANH
ncbi:carbonic anhydrase [Entomortierella parvispora]|uniref:Carbonic anhydrase n=1 Tax=Entomortierella parvispora TaxID=205924 RepID=A0A9P3H438_9FUNG|nr:carbonic anhydrase [Entomortierella parvispora]